MQQNPESIPPDTSEEIEANGTSEILDLGPDASEFKEERGDAAPLVRKALFGTLTDDTSSHQEGRQLDVLMDLPLVISIELGRTRMPAKDFLRLGTGSVIELDKLAGEPVDVLVNDRKFAQGEVVVIDENFGIRITRLLDHGSSSSD